MTKSINVKTKLTGLEITVWDLIRPTRIIRNFIYEQLIINLITLISN